MNWIIAAPGTRDECTVDWLSDLVRESLADAVPMLWRDRLTFSYVTTDGSPASGYARPGRLYIVLEGGDMEEAIAFAKRLVASLADPQGVLLLDHSGEWGLEWDSETGNFVEYEF